MQQYPQSTTESDIISNWEDYDGDNDASTSFSEWADHDDDHDGYDELSDEWLDESFREEHSAKISWKTKQDYWY